MSARQTLLGLACVVALVAAAPGEAEARKTYRAERFDVIATLAPDGVLSVTETVVFRFEGGPFTTIFRVLPTRWTDGVEVIEARLDGQRLPFGSGPGQVQVRRREGTRVTWRFAPIVDTTRTFVLTYRIRGVVEQRGDADVLRWRALPADHNYPIDASTVRVSFPQSARLVSAGAQPSRTTIVPGPGVGLIDRPGQPTTSVEHSPTTSVEHSPATSVEYSLTDIRRDRSLVVTMAFAPGMIAAPPAWQLRQLEAARHAPLFITLAAAILLAGLLALMLFWFGHRRAPVGPSSGVESPTPPDDLPVALAGALLQPGAGPSWGQAVASLLDLAGRGIIRIEEQPKRRWQQDFTVALVRRPGTLRPHERALLDHLFGAHQERSVSRLSALRKLAGKFRRFSGPLKEEMRAAGLIDEERDRTRRRLLVVGLVLAAVGAASFAAAAIFSSRFGPWPLFVGGAVIVVAVVALIQSAVFSPLSDAGAWRAAGWRAFAAYLKSVARGRTSMPDPSFFDRYLPYTAAFGTATEWATRFRKEGAVRELPGWFHALAEGDAGADALGVLLASSTASSSSAAGAAG
jgi:hypothetical protein